MRNVPEVKRTFVQFGQMGSRQSHRPWIMVAFDPNPAAARLQAIDPHDLVVIKAVCRHPVVETVTKTDHRLWRGHGNVGLETRERVSRLIGRKERSPATRDAVGLSQVEVGNA